MVDERADEHENAPRLFRRRRVDCLEGKRFRRRDHEVVIRAHAAGVNFPDGLIIQDKYQFKATPPFSPGGECAGVIAAVGAKARHWRPGMRVMAFTTYGAFAEQVRVRATAVIPMPAELDFVTAAAFVLAAIAVVSMGEDLRP